MPWSRAALVAPIVAILGFLGWISLQHLRADAALREAAARVRAWSASGSVPGDEAWLAAHEGLRASFDLVPSNPRTNELLGVLLSRRLDDAGLMAAATGHFARALTLRPVSPYTWAALAESRYGAGDTGAVFETALMNAAALGPAEPAVQRMVSHYGLALWEQLSEGARRAVENVVAAGVRRDPAEMLHIANTRGRLAIACRHLQSSRRPIDTKWRRSCQIAEAR